MKTAPVVSVIQREKFLAAGFADVGFWERRNREGRAALLAGVHGNRTHPTPCRRRNGFEGREIHQNLPTPSKPLNVTQRGRLFLDRLPNPPTAPEFLSEPTVEPGILAPHAAVRTPGPFPLRRQLQSLCFRHGGGGFEPFGARIWQTRCPFLTPLTIKFPYTYAVFSPPVPHGKLFCEDLWENPLDGMAGSRGKLLHAGIWNS
jgi:hypothetical protein